MRLFSILLVLGGAYILTMNWMCVIANVRNARDGIDKHHSLTPLVGPLFMTVGLGALVPDLGWMLVLPLLIDPGMWILVGSVPFLARQWGRGRG